MIPAFEVGASIVLDPKILRSLEEVIGQFKALDGVLISVQKSADAVSRVIRGIDGKIGNAAQTWEASAEKMATFSTTLESSVEKMAASSAMINNEIRGIAAESGSLAKEWGTVAEKMTLASSVMGENMSGGSGPRGPGGGGGERGGGGWWGGKMGAVGGAIAGRSFSIPGIASAVSVTDALKQSLTTHQAEAETLEVLGLPTTGDASRKYYAQLEELNRTSAMGTIYSVRQTADAARAMATISTWKGEEGLEKLQSVFPLIARFAENLQQYNLGSLQENVVSGMGYAHMLRQYSPEVLMKALDQFEAVAITTHSQPSGLVRTLAQGVPMAIAAGADPAIATAMVGYLIQSGLKGRAGYSVGQMLMGITDTGGPISSQMQAERARVMGGISHRLRENKHQEYLKILGLEDASGKSAITDQKGNVDLMAMLVRIEKASERLPKNEFLSAVRAVFGTAGSRGADILDMKFFENFYSNMKNIPGAQQIQSELAQQPLQILQQVWARLQDIAKILGDQLVPGFTNITSALLKFLTATDNFLTAHPVLSKVIAEAAVGATVGGIAAGVPGAGVGAIGGALWGVFSGGLSTQQQKAPDMPLTLFDVPVAPYQFPAKKQPDLQPAPSDIHKESYTPNGGMSAMPVYIINVRDLYHGIMHGMSNDAGFPPIGPTEHNSRLGQQTGGYVGASI